MSHNKNVDQNLNLESHFGQTQYFQWQIHIQQHTLSTSSKFIKNQLRQRLRSILWAQQTLSQTQSQSYNSRQWQSDNNLQVDEILMFTPSSCHLGTGRRFPSNLWLKIQEVNMIWSRSSWHFITGTLATITDSSWTSSHSRAFRQADKN